MINVMFLVLDIDESEIPDSITPVEYFKASFLREHGIEVDIIKDNYAFDRKELYLVINSDKLPCVQTTYDNTEHPLIKNIAEYMDGSWNIDPWEVMRLFLSKVSIDQWAYAVSSAYIYALCKDIKGITSPRISFDKMVSA